MKQLFLVMAIAFGVLAAHAQEPAVKKAAVFVQNRTRIAGMDDEVDGVRDRLAAAIEATGAISVADSSLAADSFRRWKTMTAEEKSSLVSGVFSGGSAARIAQMLDCDYIIAAQIVGADVMQRNMGGRLSSVYTLRMTMRVLDASGSGVFAMPPWVRQMPVLEATGEPMSYFNMLVDQWVEDAGASIANNAEKWRKSSYSAANLATVYISTTIDETIAELESQTKGAKGEELVQLRRVCGGASVEVDGAVIGSAPGTFKIAPGLHQLRITRDWMKPYSATVQVSEGMNLKVALEMSAEGLAKWGSAEALRADLARRYAEAAMTRGIKINADSSSWRDVSSGTPQGTIIIKKD